MVFPLSDFSPFTVFTHSSCIYCLNEPKTLILKSILEFIITLFTFLWDYGFHGVKR